MNKLSESKIMNCSHCNNPANDNFCSHCGLPIHLKRVDSHYVLHEIQHILHFEKGILYTIKELLYSPGENIKMFITNNRSRLVKPIIFIIITSLIYTLINNFFHIEEGYINFNAAKDSTTTIIFSWLQTHYGYANILMAIFIAFWLRLIFKKYAYNFFEILILLCFAIGMGMLIFAIFALFEGLTKLSLMKYSGVIGIAYCTWAIGQFFDKNKVSSYFKALTAYILGMISFLIAVVFIVVLIHLLS